MSLVPRLSNEFQGCLVKVTPRPRPLTNKKFNLASNIIAYFTVACNYH